MIRAAQRSSPTLAAAALVGLAACGEPAELRYQTEHLRIGTVFDAPLCQGDLDRLEGRITELEDQLDTRLDGPVEVYLWPAGDSPESRGCESDASCYNRATRTIYADLDSLDHELVHAVVHSFARPPAVYMEGAAEALGDRRSLFGFTAPVDNLGLEAPALDYRSVGHFARWLWLEFGAEAFRELLAANEGPRGAFEAAYGLTIDAAQEQFFAEAAYSYAPLTSCDDPPLSTGLAGGWSERVELDCDAPGVYGGPTGMGSYRVLEIGEHGSYGFAATTEFVTLSRCLEDLDSQPASDDPTLGEVPPTSPAMPEQFIKLLAGDGEPSVVELAPGRYRLGLGVSDHQAREIDVAVWPYAGPTPTLPEPAP